MVENAEAGLIVVGSFCPKFQLAQVDHFLFPRKNRAETNSKIQLQCFIVSDFIGDAQSALLEVIIMVRMSGGNLNRFMIFGSSAMRVMATLPCVLVCRPWTMGSGILAGMTGFRLSLVAMTAIHSMARFYHLVAGQAVLIGLRRNFVIAHGVSPPVIDGKESLIISFGLPVTARGRGNAG